jgi:beta-aspartyl-peptidase (threonine type)
MNRIINNAAGRRRLTAAFGRTKVSIMHADLSLIRISIHGGAGNPAAAEPDAPHHDALRRIAADAWRALRAGASAVDAVEQAVAALEDCPLFNAGIGAVLNADGVAELDAAIMRGSDRACGAVAAVTRLRNPVRVARAVMESSPHVLLAGSGAERFAQHCGHALVDPATLVIPERRRQLDAARRAGRMTLDHDAAGDATTGDGGFGTVGAVARDAHGSLAAATSTGGLVNKWPGRVGDTPIIGAGTFADDRSIAVSCTGPGEAFIRAGFAHMLHARMLHGAGSLQRACEEGLAELSAFGGRGGCIAIGRDGTLALAFNSAAMYRAWSAADGDVHVAAR